jgi:hypothetical protein
MTPFQADSGRNPGTIPDGFRSDSAFSKQASKNSNGTTTSSLSAAQGGRRAEESSLTARIPFRETASLAAVILSIRTDWDEVAVVRAIQADDRPWRTVVAASIRGALLDGPDTIRHPNGLRYVNPADGTTVPRLPTPAELDRAPRCPHGAVSGTCALCRNGVEA